MSFGVALVLWLYKQGAASRVCRGYARGGFAGVFGRLCQGARATVHLDIEKGENSHHIWEAAYRAFGIALGEALGLDPEKKGRTSGVAGRVGFTVETE